MWEMGERSFLRRIYFWKLISLHLLCLSCSKVMLLVVLIYVTDAFLLCMTDDCLKPTAEVWCMFCCIRGIRV